MSQALKSEVEIGMDARILGAGERSKNNMSKVESGPKNHEGAEKAKYQLPSVVSEATALGQ